jgi:hypothetical protein
MASLPRMVMRNQAELSSVKLHELENEKNNPIAMEFANQPNL